MSTLKIPLRLAALSLVVTLLVVGSAAGDADIDPALAEKLESTTGAVEAIVTFSDVPTAEQLEAIESTGADVLGLEALPFAIVSATSSQIDEIASQPGVLSIWDNAEHWVLDHTVTDEMGPGAPIADSWWLEQVRGDLVLAAGIDGGSGGEPVGIAVVDTGVDAAHPDLGFDFDNGLFQAPGRVVQNVHIEAANKFSSDRLADIIVENQVNTDSDVGHGTAVAWCAVGGGEISDGIYRSAAPGARIVGLQASTSLFLFTADILIAFDYVIRNRERYNIRVVNNSWGSTGVAQPDGPIAVSTRTMAELGIVVVFAAGNSGPPDEPGIFDEILGGDPTRPVNPHAKVPWTVSAGATSPTRGLTFFSSRDSKPDPNLPDVDPSEFVDVVAPGQGFITARASTGTTINALNATNDQGQVIQELIPFYTSLAGTSFSSPITAGVVALLLDAEPDLSPAEVRERLRKTAAPLLYEGHQVGAGLLDAANALGVASRQQKPTRPGAHLHRQIGSGFSGGFLLVAPGAAVTDVNFDVFRGAERFDVTLEIRSNPASLLDTTRQNYRVTLIDPNDVVRQVENMSILLNESATLEFSFEPEDVVFGTWDLEIVNFDPGAELNDGSLFHDYELTAEVVYKE